MAGQRFHGTPELLLFVGTASLQKDGNVRRQRSLMEHAVEEKIIDAHIQHGCQFIEAFYGQLAGASLDMANKGG